MPSISRCQIALAIAMYVGAPAWLGFMLLGIVREAPFRIYRRVWDPSIYFGSTLIALLIIAGSIPWPGLSYGRAMFR